MSTRSSLAFIERGTTIVHLYRETNDGEVYLEVEHEPSGLGILAIIPPSLVADLTAILLDAERPPETV